MPRIVFSCFLCFGLILFFADCISAQNTKLARKNELVGTLTTIPDAGFGCYFVLPADWNKESAQRRYIFFDNEIGGKMNVDGKDALLENTKSFEKKPLGKRKRYVWLFEGEDVKARFDLTVTNETNAGANISYDATVNVSASNKKQTIRAKGFCGG